MEFSGIKGRIWETVGSSSLDLQMLMYTCAVTKVHTSNLAE